jgi:hypothetical protein
MTVVRFLRHWDRYNAGETAGFEFDEANRLVKAGIAAAVGTFSVPAALAVPLDDLPVAGRRKRAVKA